MKSRSVVSIILAAALLLAIGAGCQRTVRPPVFVAVPANVFAGDTAHLRLVTYVIGYQSTGYVIDWGDTVETDSVQFPLGDTAAVSHVWSAPGVRLVRARAFPSADPTQLTDWCETETVAVVAGGSHAPALDVVLRNQQVAVGSVPMFFTVKAHDPDGDSVRLKFGWDTADTTTAYLASPCSVTVSHVFTLAETAVVVISAQDVRGAWSPPDTMLVPVGSAGSVRWYWHDTGPGGVYTSPLCLSDGQDECIYAPSDWDMMFCSIRTGNGKTKHRAQTQWPSFFFSGHPAFCQATQHVIVGSDEGELYAFDLDLQKAWQWPNKLQDSLTLLEWGPPAVRDSRLYVPREDDSLYCIIDSVDRGVRVATFPAGAGIVGAPVIDAQGNVYFGTDSGYVCKVGPDLDTLFWRARIIASGEIHSLIVGEGTILCSSGLSRIYAIDPATGTLLWTAATEGLPLTLAAGRAAVFAGTDFGTVYSINSATGSVNWRRAFGRGFGFRTAPIVAANGYVYLQDDGDALYCLNQADGALIWSCKCASYLPGAGCRGSGRSKKTQLPYLLPNPIITPDGDIIVPGGSALYCVAGYPDGPLDPLAPWPKWQHDLYNTGYAGGGR